MSAQTSPGAIVDTTRFQDIYDILRGIDPDDLRDALLAITEGSPRGPSVGEVDDPGDELPVGEGGVVDEDELDRRERIIGVNNLLPVHFLEEGVVAQSPVARVRLATSHAGLPAGSGWGTGSLVSDSLLLTNNHVIPSAAFADKVGAEFNYQFDFSGNPEQSDVYGFAAGSFFLTNAALDYTLIRVRSKPLVAAPVSVADTAPEMAALADFGPIRLAGGAFRPFLPPWRFAFRTPGQTWGHLQLPVGPLHYAHGQHLNVVGHPSGRRKEVSLQENRITTIHSNVVRYTADTEPGSSGSPVFTNGWDVVALHHAAGEWDAAAGVWKDNEGIRIDRIVDHIRTNAPAAVRTELGI